MVSSELDSRKNPNRPIVGVGVVIWRGDRFLLVRRSKEPNKGHWRIPGGARQLGETVFAAAIREVQGETGLGVEAESALDRHEERLLDVPPISFLTGRYLGRQFIQNQSESVQIFSFACSPLVSS